MQVNEITDGVIGAAIEVHRTLGPGLLESAYVQCLCHELRLPNLPLRRELSLPMNYKGLKLDCGYRVDMLVADTVVVEVKAVERLAKLLQALRRTEERQGRRLAQRRSGESIAHITPKNLFVTIVPAFSLEMYKVPELSKFVCC